ncbi:hypothetical protein [uncultured Roseovarius sp.]|uniref:hypothetical protein n=1 Tax=uncultured Roseovarius sp. TaxID=293344 RepID=UPI002610EAC6|nr:hypothetical protein [uncultured Roseovarius sp.]
MVQNNFSISRRQLASVGMLAGLGTLACAPLSSPASAHSGGLTTLIALMTSSLKSTSETATSTVENQRSLVEQLSNQGELSQEVERLIDVQFQTLGELSQALVNMDSLLKEIAKTVNQDCG